MAKKIEINYISKFRLCDEDHFLIMKGIASLMALIAYVAVAYLGIESLAPLAGVGSVIFLFCSGYGLSESYIWKKGLHHYWENKMIKVWLPSVVVLVIFSLFSTGIAFIWIEQSPLGLSGWFLYILFAYYLLFWLVFQYIEKKAVIISVLFGASAIAFAVMKNRSYAELMAAFPLGVMTSQLGFKRTLRAFNLTKRLLFCGTLIAGAVGFYILADMLNAGIIANLFWLISKTAMAILLIYGVYCLQKLKVFGVFGFLGMISYAVYLMMMMDILSLTSTPNDLKSIGIGVAILLGASAVYTWLREQLHKWNKKARRRKNPPLKGNMQR